MKGCISLVYNNYRQDDTYTYMLCKLDDGTVRIINQTKQLLVKD